jgi:UDP-N-acetylmuramate--alanine ligase
VRVYDDYGHHPTEVARTLETAREFLARPIVAVFQPHRYSRTQQMGRDFGPSFRDASRVIITPIYTAWEEPIEGVSAQIVFDAVRAQFPDKDVRLATSLEDARALVKEIAHEGDAIFCLGAGDITTLPPQILADLQEKEREPKTEEAPTA